MKNVSTLVFLTSCMLALIALPKKLIGQNDTIVLLNNEIITGITIKGYPDKIQYYFVNSYNENLMPNYDDLKIYYSKDPNDNKPDKINFNEVKRFVYKGKSTVAWHSRPIKYQDGMVTFDTILVVPNMNKEQLYNKSRSWLIEKLGLTADGISKVLIEDKESGSISIKKLIDNSWEQQPFNYPTFKPFVFFDLLVRVKDGKCRLTATNIYIHYEKGAIFDSKVHYRFDVKAEYAVANWKQGRTIKGHLYRGVNVMVYTIEDRIIKSFTELFNKKEDEW